MELSPRLCVAAALIVVLGMGNSASASGPHAVFSHLGNVDPQQQGWGITPGDTGSGVIRSAVGSGMGDDLEAWRIDDTSDGRWRYELVPSGADLAAAAQLGWVVQAVVRMPSPGDARDAAAIVELNDGVRRWALDWGADANGDALVGIFGFATTYVIPGATYHTYELRHDPVTNTVDLYVDGALLESSNPGIAAGTVAVRFNFGSGFGTGTATADYHRVRWIINGDADGDGTGDPFDNCRFVQNVGSADSGGVGAGSAPDGRGDACQCSDLDGDGFVTESDRTLLRQSLADPSGVVLSPEALFRCSASDDPDECDLTTAVRIARAVGGLGPTIAERCDAATGYGQLCGDGVCTGEAGNCLLEPLGCQQDCGPCLIGTQCHEAADCSSGFCNAGTCALNAPQSGVVQPGDGVCDPLEHCYRSGPYADPDACGPCAEGEYCHEASDCTAGLCVQNGPCTTLCEEGDHFGTCTCTETLGCIDPAEGELCEKALDCNLDGSCIPPTQVGWCRGSGAPGVACTLMTDLGGLSPSVYISDVPECDPYPVPDKCNGLGECERCSRTFFCDSDDDCNCGECEISVCQDGSRADSFQSCPGGIDDTSCWCSPERAPAEIDWRCVGSQCGDEFARLCRLGETCRFSSANCETGLFCYFLTNECVAALPDGAPCSASSQCDSGICNFGFCVANVLPEGSPCTTNAACESGLCAGICIGSTCPNGSCEPFTESCGISTGDACVEDCGLCSNTSPCSVDGDCESGFCDPDATTGVGPRCAPCADANDGRCPNGASCDSDGDCQVDNCISGFCAPPPPTCSGSSRPDGCQCTSDDQCASNQCASIPGEPDVCTSCSATLPGGACLSSSECCDFPDVDISCKLFVCQP